MARRSSIQGNRLGKRSSSHGKKKKKAGNEKRTRKERESKRKKRRKGKSKSRKKTESHPSAASTPLRNTSSRVLKKNQAVEEGSGVARNRNGSMVEGLEVVST